MSNPEQIDIARDQTESEPTVMLNQLCSNALLRNPEEQAVEFEGQWYSWGDMRRIADQLGALLEESGAGPQPKVAFVARNRPSALAAFLGLLAKRCTIRMVYPFQSTEVIAKEIGCIEPSVVVAAAEDFSDSVFGVLKEKCTAAIALEDMEAKTFTRFEHTGRPSDDSIPPQVILLTSGTTGPPKQFALGYEQLVKFFSGSSAIASGAKTSKGLPTPALLYFPVSNISGLYTTLPPLLNGLPIVLLDRFSLDGWLDHLRRFRPSMSGLPPAGIKMLLDANIPVEDLSCLKGLGAGAAPLDINSQTAFEARYGIPILLSYGATEFAGPVSAMTPDLWAKWGKQKLGSVGRPLPGVQMRIINPETEEVLAPGQEGILEVVSPRVGSAWTRTADLVVIDDDGFIFHRGRADGVIVRGGFKILPSTIEQALLLNPAIATAVVVGIPNERLGQVPAVGIVPKPGANEVTFSDIEADLRTHVPSTHIPVVWKFLDELPRTPSMKVDMPAVRRFLQEPTK